MHIIQLQTTSRQARRAEYKYQDTSFGARAAGSFMAELQEYDTSNKSGEENTQYSVARTTPQYQFNIHRQNHSELQQNRASPPGFL